MNKFKKSFSDSPSPMQNTEHLTEGEAPRREQPHDKTLALPDDPKIVLNELDLFGRGDAIKYFALDSIQRGDVSTAESYLRQYETDPALSGLNWDTQKSEIRIAMATHWFKNGDKKRAESMINLMLEEPPKLKYLFDHIKTFVVRYYLSIDDLKHAESIASSINGYTILPEVKQIAQHYLDEGNLELAKKCTALLDDNRWRAHLLVDIARYHQDRVKAIEVLKGVEALIQETGGILVQGEILSAVAEAYAFCGMPQEAERLLDDSMLPKSSSKSYLQVEYAKSLAENPEAAREELSKIDLSKESNSTRPDILVRIAEAEILLTDASRARGSLRQAMDAAAGMKVLYEEDQYRQNQLFQNIAKLLTTIKDKSGFEYLLSKPETASARTRILVEYIHFLLLPS